MSKFRNLGWKSLENNVIFEISTFEIMYRKNFVKIWKLLFFGPKMPILRNLGSIFSETNVRFEISTFELGYLQNFLKIRKLTLFGSQFGYLGLKIEKWKPVKNSRFPQIWNYGSFWVVSQFFRLVLARFDIHMILNCYTYFDLGYIKMTKIYKKITIYEYLELIFYITGLSTSWRISSYKLFTRILNIIGVKLK